MHEWPAAAAGPWRTHGQRCAGSEPICNGQPPGHPPASGARHRAGTGRALEFYIPTEEQCPALKLPPAGDLQSSPQRGTKDVKAPPPGPKAPPPGPKAPPSGGPLPLNTSETSTTSSKSEPASGQQQRKSKPAPAAPIPGDTPHLADVDTICAHLADAVQKLTGDRPKITKREWRDPARLLLDANGRTLKQVLAAIDWVFSEDRPSNDQRFWSGVITNPKVLRNNYAKLQQQAAVKRGNAKGPYHNPENQNEYDGDL